MEEIVSQYRKLIQLLEEEEKSICAALSDKPMQLYLRAVQEEKEKLEKHIYTLIQK